MKLLICDPTEAEAIERMRQAGIEVDVRDTITTEELEREIAAYDAMVVRSRTQVRAPLIDKADNLKLIIRGGVGVDTIDVKHAQARGIEVRNTPAASSNSVAELTIGFLFALARQIPQMAASMTAGKWEKRAFSKGIELSGKTLGLIGCGRIGLLVAEKAAALGMTVLSYDPYIAHCPTCVTPVTLDQLLSQADFISLHVPSSPETRNLINQETIAKMKDGVYIVNCGRGDTMDEAALLAAVQSGKVAGAALDVFVDEKEEQGKRFKDEPRVICSPHIGAGTLEALARVGGEVADIAIEFAKR